MMPDPTEAREKLSEIMEQSGSVESYVDAIWRLRYPNPAPKASDGWPYRSAKDRAAEEKPQSVRLVRK
jgi:hypothetical protein